MNRANKEIEKTPSIKMKNYNSNKEDESENKLNEGRPGVEKNIKSNKIRTSIHESNTRISSEAKFVNNNSEQFNDNIHMKNQVHLENINSHNNCNNISKMKNEIPSLNNNEKDFTVETTESCSKESIPNILTEYISDQSQEFTPEHTQENTQEYDQENMQEHIQENISEYHSESTQEDIQESSQEIIQEDISSLTSNSNVSVTLPEPLTYDMFIDRSNLNFNYTLNENIYNFSEGLFNREDQESIDYFIDHESIAITLTKMAKLLDEYTNTKRFLRAWEYWFYRWSNCRWYTHRQNYWLSKQKKAKQKLLYMIEVDFEFSIQILK